MPSKEWLLVVLFKPNTLPSRDSLRPPLEGAPSSYFLVGLGGQMTKVRQIS